MASDCVRNVKNVFNLRAGRGNTRVLIQSFMNEYEYAGAALPHFDRDGKGGDTCFFLPI